MLRIVIVRPRTAFRRPHGRIVGFVAVFGALACEPATGPTPLEQRASGDPPVGSAQADGEAPRLRSRSEKAAQADKLAQAEQLPPPSAPPAKTLPAGDESVPPPTSASTEPPPPSQRVTLALALDPAVKYRTSVVGMVSFPMTEKPTGYAREESVELRDCSGEGAQRSCTAEHTLTGFEAEPPAGRFLQADYDRVANVRSSHPIAATGRRAEQATLSAIDDAGIPIDEALTAELSEAHRLFCMRFPEEPVGVGAKWSDTCTTMTAGTVGTRTVVWELSKLDEDPQGGARAELSYVGQYSSLNREDAAGGSRKGTIQGTLYFFVDAGQPHLMREKIALPLGERGVVTQTSVNIQFAREDSTDPELRLRTDGKPFPAALPVGVAPPAP